MSGWSHWGLVCLLLCISSVAQTLLVSFVQIPSPLSVGLLPCCMLTASISALIVHSAVCCAIDIFAVPLQVVQGSSSFLQHPFLSNSSSTDSFCLVVIPPHLPLIPLAFSSLPSNCDPFSLFPLPVLYIKFIADPFLVTLWNYLS